MASLTYKDAGVDIVAADALVGRITGLAKKTLNKKVKSSIGGYASLYEIDKKRWIAASTDGVGTKLKLAMRLKKHNTVGIDLVAMSVNDLICTGAEPLFFLDYFATGKLESGVAEQVIAGIVEGCKQARCALVGGETAEMPDFYSPGEYDLAGFAVGMVEPKKVLPLQTIRPGDELIGVGSSGVHSNGLSLVRKLLPEGPLGDQWALQFLEPTRIYVRSLFPLIQKKEIKGAAHITGSGFLNVPRLSDRVSYEIALPSEGERPAVFRWLKDKSGLGLKDLAMTFNLGIGMVLVVPPGKSAGVIKKLRKSGEKAWRLGQVVKKTKNSKTSEVHVQDGSDRVTLHY